MRRHRGYVISEEDAAMTSSNRRERKPHVEDLQLTRETVQDLTESEAEAAEGGVSGACLEVGVPEPPVGISTAPGCAFQPQPGVSGGCGL
jgi:hypothetical protein